VANLYGQMDQTGHYPIWAAICRQFNWHKLGHKQQYYWYFLSSHFAFDILCLVQA
jgi:hypothetical protein